MAEEGKEKKKKSAANVDAQRLQAGTVGEILRSAREHKKLDYEEISAAIHVRPAQLRAIEEGNISGLPGMTYALGFVKSYAAFLKLNAPEMVQKFKAEHAQNMGPALHYPEPIADGPQPNWMVIGFAGFCAVLLLSLWAIFSGSGDDDKVKTAEAIPQAPAVGTVTGLNAQPAPAPAPAPAPEAAAPVTPPVAAEAAPAPAATETPAPAPEAAATPAETATTAAPETPVVVQPVQTEKPAQDPAVITIKRGKGRIVLAAKQSSWVKITGKDGEPVLQKVLRPGEQFYVPDKPGLTLVTSNAGGFDVYVDGKQVQPLGNPGEIVRGVDLDPAELKLNKVKAHDRR